MLSRFRVCGLALNDQQAERPDAWQDADAEVGHGGVDAGGIAAATPICVTDQKKNKQ